MRHTSRPVSFQCHAPGPPLRPRAGLRDRRRPITGRGARTWPAALVLGTLGTLAATPALANAGWFWILLPALAGYWWVVVLPFVFEWLTYRPLFRLSYRDALVATFLANLASTVVGIIAGFAVGITLEDAFNVSFIEFTDAQFNAGIVAFLLVTSLVNLVVEYPILARYAQDRHVGPPERRRARAAVFVINLASGGLTHALLIGWEFVL